jgi:hypothetical protein
LDALASQCLAKLPGFTAKQLATSMPPTANFLNFVFPDSAAGIFGSVSLLCMILVTAAAGGA